MRKTPGCFIYLALLLLGFAGLSSFAIADPLMSVKKRYWVPQPYKSVECQIDTDFTHFVGIRSSTNNTVTREVRTIYTANVKNGERALDLLRVAEAGTVESLYGAPYGEVSYIGVLKGEPGSIPKRILLRIMGRNIGAWRNSSQAAIDLIELADANCSTRAE